MTPDDTVLTGAHPSGDPASDPTAGRGIILLSWIGTGVLVLTGALAAALMGAFMVIYVVISLVEFALGTFVFLLALLRAIDRSRQETIGVGALFFAGGSTPRPVRRHLLGSLGVQILASIAVASVHVYTALAFGVLAPMWALGLTGLWVAAHGSFPEREFDPRLDRGTAPPPRRPGRRRPTE